jgi:uncharacterized protein YjbJ (UPF0337 family)
LKSAPVKNAVTTEEFAAAVLQNRCNALKTLAWSPFCAVTDGRSLTMNPDQFEGKWKQLKGLVKQRWGKLTDDDITAMSGKKDELIGKLQERYGITKEQAQREADEWARAAQSDLDATSTPRTTSAKV